MEVVAGPGWDRLPVDLAAGPGVRPGVPHPPAERDLQADPLVEGHRRPRRHALAPAPHSEAAPRDQAGSEGHAPQRPRGRAGRQERDLAVQHLDAALQRRPAGVATHPVARQLSVAQQRQVEHFLARAFVERDDRFPAGGVGRRGRRFRGQFRCQRWQSGSDCWHGRFSGGDRNG